MGIEGSPVKKTALSDSGFPPAPSTPGMTLARAEAGIDGGIITDSVESATYVTLMIRL
jgi:hypothetical protein